MAEDVRTRQVVQRQLSKPVFDESKPTKGIDVNAIVAPLEKGIKRQLTAAQKADKEAADLFIDMQDNAFSQLELEASAEISTSKGINSIGDNNRLQQKLRDDRDARIEKASPEMKDRLRVRLDKSLRRYQRTAQHRLFKETEDQKLKELKTKAEYSHRSAIRASSGDIVGGLKGDNFYTRELKDLDEANDRWALQQGLDSDQTKIFKSDSRSKTHLESLENIIKSFDGAKGQEFFDTVKSEITNPDDLDKAQTLLKKAEEKDIELEAGLVVQDAQRFTSIERQIQHIQAQTEPGKVRKAAELGLSRINGLKEKAKKQREDADSKSVSQALTSNGGVLTPEIKNKALNNNKLKEAQTYATFVQDGLFVQDKTQKIKGDEKFNELLDLAHNNPDAFRKVDLDAAADGVFHPERKKKLKAKQEVIQKANTSAIAKMQNDTSDIVHKLAIGSLIQRKFKPGGSPRQQQEYQSGLEISTAIWQEVVEDFPTELDRSVLKAVWAERFNAAMLELPKEFEGRVRVVIPRPFVSAGVSFRIPFTGDSETAITRTEARDRFNKGEPVLPLADADSSLLDEMREAYKTSKGKDITDEQLQRWLDKKVRIKLKLIPSDERVRQRNRAKSQEKKLERERQERFRRKNKLKTSERGTF